jgi:hypothetical protein
VVFCFCLNLGWQRAANLPPQTQPPRATSSCPHNPLVMRMCAIPRLLLLLALLCAGAHAKPLPRPFYVAVAVPSDCRPIATTTSAECAIKAAACFTKFKIRMQFFTTQCSFGPYLRGVSGCQCFDRCRLFQERFLFPGTACPFSGTSFPTTHVPTVATLTPSAAPTQRPTTHVPTSRPSSSPSASPSHKPTNRREWWCFWLDGSLDWND